MRRNEQDLLTFLSKHFRLVESVCDHQRGFQSDDELIGFLSSYSNENESIQWQARRLKEVGVLIQGATGWSPPPFLVKFIQELRHRHVLASPVIVRGWIEQLSGFENSLGRRVDELTRSLKTPDEDLLGELLRDVEYTFGEVVRIVQGNCERIATDVAEYRTTEDLSKVRSRLERLIVLHDDYLQPVITLIDINGTFYDVSGKIASHCERFANESVVSENLRLRASSIKQQIIWLRLAIIRQADEAIRELSPLCRAAVQEQKISKGVNRALEFARLLRWEDLDIPSRLQIVDDKNGPQFSDLAIERYVLDAISYRDEEPPMVLLEEPSLLENPATAHELVEKLNLEESVDDLLLWILNTSESMELEEAMQLLQATIDVSPERTNSSQKRSRYTRNQFQVDAHLWRWENENGNS